VAALNTNKLTILLDGVERAAEVSKVAISNAETDSDFVSFASAAAGGSRDWSLTMTAVQDPGDADSVWSLLWDSPGTEVDVLVRPYGNATASATQPHWEGTCLVQLPDGDVLGGETNRSASARWTVELSWPFTERPTRVVA
jgi:hypothetical protein